MGNYDKAYLEAFLSAAVLYEKLGFTEAETIQKISLC